MATGFHSLANADRTAKNTFAAMQQAGLGYSDLVFWNAIPWSGARKVPITPAMRQRGEAMLGRLMPLLPRLRAVLLLGGEAHRLRPAIEGWRPRVRVITCAHTSPLAWNHAHHREGVLAAFCLAAAVAKPGA
jgi:uracil-DNA glycosylase